MNWSSNGIRRLLRSAKAGGGLESDASGVALKAACRASSVREALDRSVEKTFAHEPHLARFLWQPAVEGYSKRQYFRLRSRALALLADQIERTLCGWSESIRRSEGQALRDIDLALCVGLPRAATTDLAPNQCVLVHLRWARYFDVRGDEASFQSELSSARDLLTRMHHVSDSLQFEWFDVLRLKARRYSDIKAGREAAYGMQRNASESAQRIRALLAQAEAACIGGDIEAAERAIQGCDLEWGGEYDAYTLAQWAGTRAQVAFLQSDNGTAFAYAKAASRYMATVHRGLASRFDALANRALLQRGSLPPISTAAAVTWYDADALCAAARGYLLTGQMEHARESAMSAFRVSQGSVGAHIFAIATVAEVERRAGATRKARVLGQRAEALLNRHPHALYRHDLLFRA